MNQRDVSHCRDCDLEYAHEVAQVWNACILHIVMLNIVLHASVWPDWGTVIVSH